MGDIRCPGRKMEILTLHHCNTLQHAATLINTLQRTTTPCYTLQHTATHGNTLQHAATLFNTLQYHTAKHCTATRCIALQHT